MIELFKYFELIPIKESIRVEKVSDEEYFGPKYRNYISNSRLKLINPDEGGSPSKYKDGLKSESSSSMTLGTAVHQLILEKEYFELCDIDKPSAKLGIFADEVFNFRSTGKSIAESIELASDKANYFKGKLKDDRLKKAIKESLDYYINYLLKDKISLNGKTKIALDPLTRLKCRACVDSINSHKKISAELSKKSCVNESAIFMEFKVLVPENPYDPKSEKKEVVLRVKGKIDDYSYENGILTLNDLKTTGKPIGFFMKDYGSFYSFHYSRQMALYAAMLRNYIISLGNPIKEYYLNMLVVETVGEYRARLCKLNSSHLMSGWEECKEMLFRVAYHELNGYERGIGEVDISDYLEV